jgi:predicted outer membrane repeat protein
MNSDRSRMGTRRRRDPGTRSAWLSLAGGVALIAGLTSGAVLSAAPAGATSPHVARSANDLLQAPHFTAFDTVHATFTVTNFGDDPTGVPANCTTPSNNCTLRDAVAAANADTGNLDGILIPSGNTVTLTEGDIDFENSVLLDGTGSSVNGGGDQIFFMDTTGITVQITGATLTNGDATVGGAIQQDSGALLLNGVTLSSNEATGGGAIYSDDNLWIDNSAFASNTGFGTSADESGGGLYMADSSSAFIENTLFQGNGATYGGGIDNYDGALTLNDSTFVGNNSGPETDPGNGAGLYADELTLGTGDTFDNNSLPNGGNGAGVENEVDLTLTDSHIDNNTCGGGSVDGCGLYDEGDVGSYTNVTVDNTFVGAGSSEVEGGAVDLDGQAELNGVSIAGTTVVTANTVDGGAFANDSNATVNGLSISGTSVTADEVDGGAFYNDDNLSVNNLTIASTFAHGSEATHGEVEGGAIYNDDNFNLSGASVTGTTSIADLASTPTPSTDEAEIDGGALYNDSEATISSLSITNTTATASGGDGDIEGGVVYNDDLLNMTNVNGTGATVTADDYVEGGLYVNYSQANDTDVTFGSATVNVPGSTAETDPEANGSILYSDSNLEAVNMTLDDVTATVAPGGSFNSGVEIGGNRGNAFTNTTMANNTLSGPSGNTFGLYLDSGGSLSLLNTIVSMSAGCGFASGGNIASQGHNLDNVATCGLTAPGDIQGANPLVQPLANNGGQVLTAALASTSPAIDAGSNVGCPSTDARGIPRPQAGTCDIGAFEYVHQGYWMVGNDGGVFNYGDAQFEGSMGGKHLNAPVVGIAGTGDVGGGYWLAASDGGVFNFGNAGFHGSAGSIHLNKPVVGIAGSSDGGGYWLAASDGGVFNYGDAHFHGSAGSIHLNKPVVGIAATPDGGGYWLVASDGGVFNYGDANFYGSAGSIHLNKPIVGIASTPDGKGYWLVASDGGIFSYGDATFYGSTGSLHLNQPITGMASGPQGQGYWLFAADGGVFSYGDSLFLGSVPGSGAHVTNIVGGANT